MSAQLNLAGLFPPTNEEIWNPDMLWQPIPVHIVPKVMDHVLSAHKLCPAYEEEFSSVIESEDYMKIVDQFNNLSEYLTEHSGRSVETLGEIEKIRNTLFIETIYNKT